jgi:hypothetical protein
MGCFIRQGERHKSDRFVWVGVGRAAHHCRAEKMRFHWGVVLWLGVVQVAAAAATAAAQAMEAVEDCYHAHSLRGYHNHVPPPFTTLTVTTHHLSDPQKSNGHNVQQLDRTVATARGAALFVANNPH